MQWASFRPSGLYGEAVGVSLAVKSVDVAELRSAEH